jgi:hypothetical protein
MTLGTTARACRPYRAKTKGKVEPIIREVKEDFLPWLTGQGLPPRPSLFDYDEIGRRWAIEVVAKRRHRTTGLGGGRGVARRAGGPATDTGPPARRRRGRDGRHVERHRPRRDQGQGRDRVPSRPRRIRARRMSGVIARLMTPPRSRSRLWDALRGPFSTLGLRMDDWRAAR